MNADLTTASRQIARAALGFPFDANALAATTSREAVALCLDRYREAMRPAKALTKAEREPQQRDLAQIIRSIGLRIRPDFSEDQAQTWIASVIEALTDQPLRIAIDATRDALHLPIRFPGEVHPVILDRAAVHRANHERAIRNLETLLKRIDQPPALTASESAKREAAEIEIAELQSMTPAMRSLGLSGGWLVEEPDQSIRWATEAEQEAHARAKSDERDIARARGNGERP